MTELHRLDRPGKVHSDNAVQANLTAVAHLRRWSLSHLAAVAAL